MGYNVNTLRKEDKMTRMIFPGKWDPFNGIRTMQRELERLAGRGLFGEAQSLDAGVYPPINVWTSPDEIVVECELAGVNRDDVDLSITGETLIIKGFRQPCVVEEEEVRFHRNERFYGEFTRTVVLPEAVNADKISAKMSDGILVISLPKAESAVPRKINVQ